MGKKDSTRTLELFGAKNRKKKHKIFENCDQKLAISGKAIAHPKAIAFAKWPIWVEN